MDHTTANIPDKNDITLMVVRGIGFDNVMGIDGESEKLFFIDPNGVQGAHATEEAVHEFISYYERQIETAKMYLANGKTNVTSRWKQPVDLNADPHEVKARVETVLINTMGCNTKATLSATEEITMRFATLGMMQIINQVRNDAIAQTEKEAQLCRTVALGLAAALGGATGAESDKDIMAILEEATRLASEAIQTTDKAGQ